MKKINMRNCCLIISVFFALLFKYWSIWGLMDDSLKYVFLLVSIFFALLNLFRKKYSKKSMRSILLFGVLSAIVCYITGEIDFIYAFLLAMVFMDEEEGDYLFIKYYVLSGLILFLITILFGKLGITKSYNAIRRIDGVTIQRSSLGFEHVNAVFKNFFPICLGLYMLFYNKKTSKKILLYSVIVLTGYVLYKATNCRTGYIAVILIPIADIIYSRMIKKRNFKIIKYFFIIFTLVSVGIAFAFGKSNNEVNVLLSNRPILYYEMLTQSNITLFGNESNVDNTYFWLLYHKGLIVYMLYLLIYMKSVEKLSLSGIFVLPILLFGVYSMFENLDVYNYNFLFVIELITILNKNKVKYRWIKNEKDERTDHNEKKIELYRYC